jgi:hypothetical protein
MGNIVSNKFFPNQIRTVCFIKQTKNWFAYEWSHLIRLRQEITGMKVFPFG